MVYTILKPAFIRFQRPAYKMLYILYLWVWNPRHFIIP